MALGPNGTTLNGRMTLIDAALLMERLQARAANPGEVEALRMARNALLTLVSEGYLTLAERLGRSDGEARTA